MSDTDSDSSAERSPFAPLRFAGTDDQEQLEAVPPSPLAEARACPELQAILATSVFDCVEDLAAATADGDAALWPPHARYYRRVVLGVLQRGVRQALSALEGRRELEQAALRRTLASQRSAAAAAGALKRRRGDRAAAPAAEDASRAVAIEALLRLAWRWIHPGSLAATLLTEGEGLSGASLADARTSLESGARDVLGSMEPAGLRRTVGGLERLAAWACSPLAGRLLPSASGSLGELAVARFLERRRAEAGPAAVGESWRCLDFANRRLRTAFVLPVKPRPAAGAAVRLPSAVQAAAAPPEALRVLEEFAVQAPADYRRALSALVGPVMFGTWLRLAHLQRSVLLELSSDQLRGLCLRGKSPGDGGIRHAFEWSLPRFGVTGADLGVRLWQHWTGACKRHGKRGFAESSSVMPASRSGTRPSRRTGGRCSRRLSKILRN